MAGTCPWGPVVHKPGQLNATVLTQGLGGWGGVGWEVRASCNPQAAGTNRQTLDQELT